MKKTAKRAMCMAAVAMMMFTGCGRDDRSYEQPVQEVEYEEVYEEEQEVQYEAASAKKSGGTWLPDPGPAMGCNAVYSHTETEDGVEYDYYTYDLKMTGDAISHFDAVYGSALADIGFNLKAIKLNSSNFMFGHKYSKNGGASALMAVFATEYSGAIDLNKEAVWRVVLAVPENMDFHAGQGAPGIVNGNTLCDGCHGTGYCGGCGGTGRVNYGDGYEECVSCDGSRICNICDGEGSY